MWTNLVIALCSILITGFVTYNTTKYLQLRSEKRELYHKFIYSLKKQLTSFPNIRIGSDSNILDEAI
jgi:hypothetical protein